MLKRYLPHSAGFLFVALLAQTLALQYTDSMPTVFENALPLSIIINPLLLWILVGLVFIIFAITSFLLIYHWKRYTFDKSLLTKTIIVYFIISTILLATSIV